MAQAANNTNNIFIYALIGALLFVAAFSYTVVHFSNIITFKLPNTMVASALIASSASLLFLALKGDKNRLPQP